ncbi:DUF2157 domain-containing protein [Halomonas sp. MCCC 1A17488]|uniref:DUF2157 domain-containing protein n=1 Tax=unclassified Halomonas TaxID=2609666 RepID=UPI0018D1FB80|nr:MULTISPECIES: DUF2157 domain-containing protein [unclassified Halomonas]MCE8016612.1 DUF2157 domain-containing protein [Halomonas sp. MCCC 1A17488]MCG3239945.1 DUF2157 domain-containing protein [Halomonas sp. MCCC 1A17488]QPP50163.1 DUF2157 domain-containing protein [Halomonas sp. SS10-MC5]
MASIRRELVALIERGEISREQVARAVALSGLHPSGRAWAVFLDRLLLWLGTLALTCGLLFLIAYNWTEMGRWLRFGLVQAALLAAIGVYWWAEGRGGAGGGIKATMVARAALMAASLLLGVLLALFGQVYQTGADPWQLFFFWAVLMLPWTLVARFDALWVLWLGLLNLALALYFRTWGGAFDLFFDSDTAALWGLFALNTAALTLWELGARRWRWLSVGWAARLLALGSGIPLTLLMIVLIFDERVDVSPAILVYPLWLAALYAVYRHWRPDLFMLAGGCLSVIAVVTLFLARHLLWQAEAGGFLLLAVAVLALGAAAAVWLKRLHVEMSS